jgi:hypothetical protein
MEIIISQLMEYPTHTSSDQDVFGPDEYSKFRVKEIIAETDKAWLIHIHNNTHSFTDWFPKSQCVISKSQLFFYVTQWLYIEKIKQGHWKRVVFISPQS